MYISARCLGVHSWAELCTCRHEGFKLSTGIQGWQTRDWCSEYCSFWPPITSPPQLRKKYSNLSDTVDSRYLDPSYLDPITYVELISKSRLFSLCIYCISASRMSNYFYVNTSAILSIIFSPRIYFSQFLLRRISNSDHDEGKKNVRCGAACLSVNENHNRPLINKSIF